MPGGKRPDIRPKRCTLAGQLMPLINCGGTSQAVKAGDHYSNYSEFLPRAQIRIRAHADVFFAAPEKYGRTCFR